ncbi:MAG: hypothetical protein GXC72_04260 [Chitinophagaceae bacterium]|nr:hypothetical protein [Chitinophagaceae bacterium]
MQQKLFILFFLTICSLPFAAQSQQNVATDTSIMVVAEPDTRAEFRGGVQKWGAFLEKELDRNLLIRQNAPTGNYRVIASFIVDKDGTVKNIVIEDAQGKDYGTDKEMIRILKLSSKKWVPATLNGQPVAYRHRQSLTFQHSF